MVAGPARGAILGACFRPWCDKRRPRSRSRLFLGRPVRHPGTSAVGARAATRHPGNKRQVLLLACLRACPRGGAPTALRPACVVTRLSHACAATQPRRLVCTHSLAIVNTLPPHRFSADAVRSLTCTLCCFCIISCKCCTYIAVHTCTYPMDGARECSRVLGARECSRVLFRRLACTPCCRPPAFCTCPRSPGSLARWPPRYAHVTARASMYHTPRTALRALYHYSCAKYVDVMLVSRRLWGGVRASRATCCPPRPL